VVSAAQQIAAPDFTLRPASQSAYDG